MLVDVVRMRREGRRLPREQLRGYAPLRGELQVLMVRSYRAQGRLYLATLVKPGSITDQLIPQLEQVEITRMSGESFILAGTEDCGHRKVSRLFRQSWWCRLVTTAPRLVLPAAG